MIRGTLVNAGAGPSGVAGCGTHYVGVPIMAGVAGCGTINAAPCKGFTKRHLRAGTDTVALFKNTNTTEIASLSSATVVRLDESKGTYRAVEPYLTGGPVKVVSLESCQEKCAQNKECRYGTFITAGVNANQCWLSAVGRTGNALLCASPCQSFSKSLLSGHQARNTKQALLMP